MGMRCTLCSSIRYSLLIYSVFLVTVHDPICTSDGDLSNALYGSFLPVPSNDLFPLDEPSAYAREAAPGAVIVSKKPIVINKDRERVQLRVTNNGDRPIQVTESPLSTTLLFSNFDIYR